VGVFVVKFRRCEKEKVILKVEPKTTAKKKKNERKNKKSHACVRVE
jgi:hypothetical protein